MLTYRANGQWNPDTRSYNLVEKEVVDALGQEIVPGSIVTYPVGASSSLHLSFAVITAVEITPRTDFDGRQLPDDLVFRALHPSWRSNYSDDGSWDYEEVQKKVRLERIERMIVITDEQAAHAGRGLWARRDKSIGERLLEIAREVRHDA
jgi:hypothetical protein